MRTEDRSHTLARAFDQVADTYDVMVALNPGYHDHLRAAADVLVAGLAEGDLVLDLGCGSGASTRALLAAAADRGIALRVVGVDASGGMVAQARRKVWPADVEFRVGRAEEVRADQFDAPVRGILACYLLRNVPDLVATVGALADVLAPGARLVAQEYSVRGDPSAQRRWRWVNRLVILPLAAVVARRLELYRYLHRSVDEFASMDEVAQTFLRAGFENVRTRTVPGWQHGILHTLTAARPQRA